MEEAGLQCLVVDSLPSGIITCLVFRASLHIIGVSLSKPHPSVTSLHPCVCMFAWCLLAWTDHLPYVTSGSNIMRYASCLQKRIKTWTMNRLRSSYLLDGNNNDGDHSWTYLFSG